MNKHKDSCVKKSSFDKKETEQMDVREAQKSCMDMCPSGHSWGLCGW